MSKRFGRNQKRAMRQTIAIVEEENAKLHHGLILQQGIGKHLTRKVETMQGALNDVARELGQYFYGLPPVKECIAEFQDRFRLPSPQRLEDLMFRDTDEISHLISCSAYELSLIKSIVERDKFTGSVHIQLETPSGRKFYGISASAWESMRRDPKRMEQQFLPMIAREMSLFITGEKR